LTEPQKPQSQPDDEAQAIIPPPLDAEVIEDLDAASDDIDAIHGGCKGTRLLCSPTYTA
jgi:hypothetical protein